MSNMKKTMAFFAEKAMKEAKLEAAGKILHFKFPDGSALTFLIEKEDVKEELLIESLEYYKNKIKT